MKYKAGDIVNWNQSFVNKETLFSLVVDVNDIGVMLCENTHPGYKCTLKIFDLSCHVVFVNEIELHEKI